MESSKKIKVDFDSPETKELLNFITETQEGKYTKIKPNLTQVTYKRIEIQEQDNVNLVEENADEIILYGIL